MEYTCRPRGTCSTKITFSLEGGVVTALRYEGGCSGNLQGLSRLAVGRRAEELVEILQGIDCDRKGTSCPDQLAKALQKALREQR